MKIGLIVNPIAGVGAALAWKGTDDVIKAWEAVAAGEKQPVWEILQTALSSIDQINRYEWFIDDAVAAYIDGRIVYKMPEASNSKDTTKVTKILIENQIDLLLFVGGDGIASDIAKHSAETPILGIPAGVKIYSPCFLHKPEDLGQFLQKWNGETNKVDILDLDEEAYRNGQNISRLVGSASIPVSPTIQVGKSSFGSNDSDHTFQLIAERINEENWLDNKTILVGPGSTMKSIFQHLGMTISLLGVDIIANGSIIKLDCTEREIDNQEIDEIWITPIGSQGHILGRGNRQIGKKMLSKISKSNVRLFSTPAKLLETPTLFIDTGNNEVNEKFKGYYRVITGYYEEVMRKAE